jgi:EAL domain-containing protein (putative c-di-GMP-specific phosphodiesterase class I)
VLEHISDRLARLIQNEIWGELAAPMAKRRLPECVKSMPQVVVGYGSAIYNPCLDPHESIASAIDSSARFASIQSVRNLDRHREMMTTLIQAPGLLYPNYQGVFKLQGLSKEMVDQASKGKSIAPLESHLYAFESLIRVKTDEVRALMGSAKAVVDPAYLRPDILFEIAKSTKVALELDQACLNLAITNGVNLPGYLMVNILPRNLYFLRHLHELFRLRGDIILEVSESEAINNIEMLEDVRKQVSDRNVLIAADDFGRAFAGLDRIIQMKPQLIKFDRSLIQDIHQDPVKHSYLSGLISAARLLNTTCLAEGVEKWEELEVLQSMGVELVQGFLLHRPQDVDTVLKQLSQKSNLLLGTVA